MSTTRVPVPKQKLIETAARLVFRQGWNATGINQILGEADVPKGSFYYYFQSKDDLGAALVRHHTQNIQALLSDTLLNDAVTPKVALENFFEAQLKFYEAEGWRWGCPVGSICNEIADTTEKIAVACRDFLVSLEKCFTQLIARGQQDGTFTTKRTAEQLGAAAAQVWQGSLLYMKGLRNGQPLQAGADAIRLMLLNA